ILHPFCLPLILHHFFSPLLWRLRLAYSSAVLRPATPLAPSVLHQNSRSRIELTVPNASANLAHTHGGRGNVGSRGRGRSNRGRGCAQGNSTGTRPTCQLCNKYGHQVFDCWHRFDENFVPVN
ncbi:retrotransposon protein putative Ty1-copia subclass, partial [Trifolium medium]|nr:retrotransposon protein putative Ty1-copia subclass [Trifolium medium]